MKFIEHSSDGPICLFIHGFPNDHRIWRSQIETLKRDFRVITVDLFERPSNRWSLIPAKDLKFSSVIDSLKDQIQALRKTSAQKAVYVIAHDLGCFFADDIASDGDLKVSGQILINGKSLRHYCFDLTTIQQLLKFYYVLLLQLPGMPLLVSGILNRAVSRGVYFLARVSRTHASSLIAESCFAPLFIYRSLLSEAIKRVSSVGSNDRKPNCHTALVQSRKDPFLSNTTPVQGHRFYGSTVTVYSIDSTHWSPVTDEASINEIILYQLQQWDTVA